MSEWDQHWSPDEPPQQPGSTEPTEAPAATPTPPEAAPTAPTQWWTQTKGAPAAPAGPPTTPVPGRSPFEPPTTDPTPSWSTPAAPSWPPAPPTQPVPPAAPSAPSASPWGPPPVAPPPGAPAQPWAPTQSAHPQSPPTQPQSPWPPSPAGSGGGWGAPVPPAGGGWNQPASQPASRGKRALAAIAALALVIASAGIGAAIAVAVHKDSSSTASSGFNSPFDPNANSGNGFGNGSSNGFGNGSSNSNGSGSASIGTGSLNANAVASTVTPALVNINTTLSQGRAAGTGMVITSSGEVLTNNHVIADATSISVDIGGTGNTHSAHVIGYDKSHDVAVIQIEGVSNLKTVTFGDAAKVRIGDPVVAIGNALGKGGSPTVSQGKVTALDQVVTAGDSAGGTTETLTGMIQIDAPIQPGDSGGALVDAQGHVIGMNTAASAGQFRQQSSSVGFAIPENNAQTVAKRIQTGTETDGVHIGGRALLGVNVRSVPDAAASGTSFAPVQSGAVVVGLSDGSAAAAAGIKEGGVVTAINGKAIADDAALHTALAEFHPGDQVTVQWTDVSGQAHSTSVKLGVGPPD